MKAYGKRMASATSAARSTGSDQAIHAVKTEPVLLTGRRERDHSLCAATTITLTLEQRLRRWINEPRVSECWLSRPGWEALQCGGPGTVYPQDQKRPARRRRHFGKRMGNGYVPERVATAAECCKKECCCPLRLWAAGNDIPFKLWVYARLPACGFSLRIDKEQVGIGSPCA